MLAPTAQRLPVIVPLHDIRGALRGADFGDRVEWYGDVRSWVHAAQYAMASEPRAWPQHVEDARLQALLTFLRPDLC